MTVRIVLADDHPATRSGLRVALEQDGFTVVAEVGSGPAAVDATLQHRPQVALVDVNMPGSGIAAARAISQQVPDTAVVMLTVSREDEDLFEALRAGARGYLLKDIDAGRLPHALRAVLSGEAALPRSLMARVLEEFRVRERHLTIRRPGVLVRLTPREWEVLEMLAGGLATQDIAERMFVAPVTVRTHVAAILRKLHVPDRAAAVRFLNNG